MEYLGLLTLAASSNPGLGPTMFMSQLLGYDTRPPLLLINFIFATRINEQGDPIRSAREKKEKNFGLRRRPT